MATNQRNRYENYEKPSKEKQWQEKSEAPIITTCMTKTDILQFGRYLAQSYQCDNSDIEYDFEKITDENDEDREDCLWLKYKMKCGPLGKTILRVIYSIKIPVPDEIKKKAEDHRRAESINSRKRLALPAPPESAKPKLRKPVRKI